MSDAILSDELPNRRARMTILAAGCLIFMAAPACAGDGWPQFTLDASIEIEDEYVFRSTDPESELNDGFATVEGLFTLVSPSGTGLYGLATLEPVTDATRDRFFEDFGLYLEELYFALELDEATIRIGKFNPDFDIANDEAPGIYGDELAGDYELTERIGLAVGLPFAALGGEHGLSVAAFAADTTVLSDSLFTSRGQLRRRDGGVSNTETPQSFALSLAGDVGETGYNLGLRRQRRGTGDEANEFGGVLAVTRRFDVGGTKIAVLGELAHFPDFDGGHESASFVTVGGEAALANLALSAIVGRRKVEGSKAEDLITVTLEFELRDGLSLGLGYRFLEEDGEKSHTAGALLTFEMALF